MKEFNRNEWQGVSLVAHPQHCPADNIHCLPLITVASPGLVTWLTEGKEAVKGLWEAQESW